MWPTGQLAIVSGNGVAAGNCDGQGSGRHVRPEEVPMFVELLAADEDVVEEAVGGAGWRRRFLKAEACSFPRVRVLGSCLPNIKFFYIFL